MEDTTLLGVLLRGAAGNPMIWMDSYDEVLVQLKVVRRKQNQDLVCTVFDKREPTISLEFFYEKGRASVSQSTSPSDKPQEVPLRPRRSRVLYEVVAVPEFSILILNQTSRLCEGLERKVARLSEDNKKLQDKITLVQNERHGVRANTKFPMPKELADQLMDQLSVHPDILEAVLREDKGLEPRQVRKWLEELFADAKHAVVHMLTAYTPGVSCRSGVSESAASKAPTSIASDFIAAPRLSSSVRTILQDEFPSWIDVSRIPTKPPDESLAHRQQDIFRIFVGCALTQPELHLDWTPEAAQNIDVKSQFIDKAPRGRLRSTDVFEMVLPGLVQQSTAHDKQSFLKPRYIYYGAGGNAASGNSSSAVARTASDGGSAY